MDILSQFELWTFLAGLGIFLFGMHMMEESIRLLSGGAFKSLIRRYTGTRLRAIFSGAVSTAILQSSSAVSLMVLAFTGAGIMSLAQAIAVMMGAKIGTTATAWIVAVFGFKMNIDTFSLPLIGIGGLGMIALARSPKYVNISKFLVAFGFLFMGLDYMKNSVDQVSALIDPAMFAGYGIVVFALAGMILTALMQSSSATIAIVLTMLFSGLVSFPSAAAMVVGANVGTTVTVLLGSIGALVSKKRAAVSLLVFAFSTAVVTLLALPVLTWLVLSVFGMGDHPVLGLALFHSLFNILGVMMFYPFIPHLVNRVERWIPDHQVDLRTYINRTDPSVADAGEEALRKEILCQLKQSAGYTAEMLFRKPQKEPLAYSDLEQYHGAIFEYYTRVNPHIDQPGQAEHAERLLRSSRNIMNAVKNLHGVRDELFTLSRETETAYREAYLSMEQRLKEVLTFIHDMDINTDEEQSEHIQLKVQRTEDLLDKVNREDKHFIRQCGDMVAEPGVKKTEVTYLLMLNRTVTQSLRMLLHAAREVVIHSNGHTDGKTAERMNR